MKWTLTACIAVLFFAVPVMAQQTQMEEYLNTGTEQERAQKIISLGVKRESAELTFEGRVKWRIVRTESHREMALLFTPCDSVYASYLYLLKNTDRGWRALDDVDFDCHYDNNVSFEVASFRRPNVDDVLVHHDCEEHGTGYVKQNFKVFAIVSSRFKLVLSTEEMVRVSGWPGGVELDQKSSFAVKPILGAGSGSIKETRFTKESGNLAVETRDFQWSTIRLRFVPSKFIKVKQPE